MMQKMRPSLKMKSANASNTITALQSMVLVKNTFRAAFCSIAYMRNFFSDDSFELDKIGNTEFFRITKAQDNEAQTFLDWLEQGIFDALQKKYLDVVFLQVFSVDKKDTSPIPKACNLLEVFSFGVTYGRDGAQLRVSSGDPSGDKDTIKKNTTEVLHTLVHMISQLQPLPRERILSVKMLYTGDTPAEYEPPAFEPVTSDEERCWFVDEPARTSAGAIRTPFHELKMMLQTKTSGKRTQAGVASENRNEGWNMNGKAEMDVEMNTSVMRLNEIRLKDRNGECTRTDKKKQKDQEQEQEHEHESDMKEQSVSCMDVDEGEDADVDVGGTLNTSRGVGNTCGVVLRESQNVVSVREADSHGCGEVAATTMTSATETGTGTGNGRKRVAKTTRREKGMGKGTGKAKGKAKGNTERKVNDGTTVMKESKGIAKARKLSKGKHRLL